MYIPNKWTLDDPWNRRLTSLSPEAVQADIPTFSSLQTFPATRLVHCTHRCQADGILDKGGFVPVPYVATPGHTFVRQTQRIDGEELSSLLPQRGEVLPGKYVWFSIDPDLSLEQKDACHRLLRLPSSRGDSRRDCFYRQGIKMADYIERHSRYGSWAFRIDLATLLDNYRQSRRLAGRHDAPAVYFKHGGTKRYKHTATYVIVVCAIDQSDGSDPLPNLPNLNRTELQAQKIFNPRGLLDDKGRVKCDCYGNITDGIHPEFRPRGVSVGQYHQTTDSWHYHEWDQLDFAFHFPRDSEQQLPSGVFPQRTFHDYCVPLKRGKIVDCSDLQSHGPEGVPDHLLHRLR